MFQKENSEPSVERTVVHQEWKPGD
jgi:hypothetical protein